MHDVPKLAINIVPKNILDCDVVNEFAKFQIGFLTSSQSHKITWIEKPIILKSIQK